MSFSVILFWPSIILCAKGFGAEIDFKGLQRGWTSPDAEIHLVVRSHGQAITEDDGYLEQISNFNDEFGGCCENQQAPPYAPNCIMKEARRHAT